MERRGLDLGEGWVEFMSRCALCIRVGKDSWLVFFLSSSLTIANGWVGGGRYIGKLLRSGGFGKRRKGGLKMKELGGSGCGARSG